MGPKRMNSCVTKGKERVDREQRTKYQFDSLDLEVNYPGTAVLLLQCQEKPILLAATAALAKFGGKDSENLEVLFDLEVVDNLIPLITHDDLFTRRFAAKLLAEMVVVQNVREFLLDNKYYMPYFTKILNSENDTFMQEFASTILSELTKDVFGASQLLKQCSNMDFLFYRLLCPDPDVKKNTIQIVYNLLQDPLGAKKIIDTKNFKLEPVYELFNSSYPKIQKLALDVMSDFLHRNQDDHFHELFRQSNGLQALLHFLDNIEWEDLHGDVLNILALAGDNPTTVEMLNDIGGIKQILNYIGDMPNSTLFMKALGVAVRLTCTSKDNLTTSYLKVIAILLYFKLYIPRMGITFGILLLALYTYGIVDYLLRILSGSPQTDMYEITCQGIGMMTKYSPAATELTEKSCMKNILDVLRNDGLKWSTRQAALFALNQLLNCDIRNCWSFLHIQGQSYLLWLMKQAMDLVPVEIRVGAVQCLDTMARNQALRGKETIINTEVVTVLCASFELNCISMNDFKIACCKTLSVMCMEKKGRYEFLKAEGPSRMYNLLCDIKSIPIRNVAAQLIQLLCADPVLADAFVMLSNRSTARVVPSWDTCIDALFNSHLPMKFALTGRLSLHDNTKDGFYVLRRNVCTFPVLADIFRFNFCPLEPIYVVNCARPAQSTIDEDSSYLLSLYAPIKSNGVFLSSAILHLTADTSYGRLQYDACLYDYIELFKCKLIAVESKNIMSKASQGLVNTNYVASRATMLAKFVAKQMSGPDPLIRCVDHQLEVHLKEIKHSIETSVIPLGMLRVGSYFERALLFKVIADRIHLPAALVRGQYGIAWIEIAVPKITIPEEDSFHTYIHRDANCPEMITVHELQRPSGDEKSLENDLFLMNSSQSVLPSKLMKPNFIMDLMYSPGDLIPIGSRRARLYCEKRLTYGTVCHDI